MERWRLSVTVMWLVAGAGAMLAAEPARADILPPGGGPIPPREVRVTGTMAELTEGHITLDTQPRSERRTFALGGPVHNGALGLRLGDTVDVLLRGQGNPFAAPVAVIDRVLPGIDLPLRVYESGAAVAWAALGQAPGCWVSEGDRVEACFVSSSDAVALLYGADGKLACSARLAPAAERARWTVAAAPSCSGNARWALTGLRCDGAHACVAEGAGDERLAMTRR
jgi:hypothetical protein